MKNAPLLRKDFMWNMLASLVYASMSFLMTLMTMQLCGAEAGGVFSIAFSSAQMLQTVAAFGMRNYQASDISFQFQFKEYLSSRVITSLAMVAICGLYAGVMGFQGEKLTIYILFCGIKLVEALADVLEGMMQQYNRLDCAAKGLFLRSIFVIAVYIITLLMGCPLVTASWLALFASVLGSILSSGMQARKFDRLIVSLDLQRIGELMAQCFPLFIVGATWSYINNAPKIAIELHMDDQAQARFAIVFMPAFVINLVSGFIFRPLLNTMATYFVTQDKDRFRKLIHLMILIVAGITLAALIGIWLLGVPVLSLIYGVDISAQKGELLLVVFSGGFCALICLLCQSLTVMRQQNRLVFCYLIVSVLTFAVSSYLVGNYGMIGAAILYFFSMGLLTVCLMTLCIYSMKKYHI